MVWHVSCLEFLTLDSHLWASPIALRMNSMAQGKSKTRYGLYAGSMVSERLNFMVIMVVLFINMIIMDPSLSFPVLRSR